MYDQIREDTLYIILYAMVTAIAMMASCYLLLRRANGIAPDVTPPMRLRRWTAAFFAAITLSHIWYMPMLFRSTTEEMMRNFRVGAVLDCMILLPLAAVVPVTMLQDRRRPLWPVAVVFAPLVAGMAWVAASHDDALMPKLRVYILLLGIGLFVYMVRALRQYGRWLRDNYADLEHKEVWQSLVVLAVMLLVMGIYSFAITDMASQYVLQVNEVILVGYLLWRVETLSDLGTQQAETLTAAEDDLQAIGTDDTEEETEANALPPSIRERSAMPLSLSKKIEAQLKQHCEDGQLYLQHDITATQLATEIGVNRSYLSQYFSGQGTTYNAYINDLRIQHFVRLYHEAAAIG
ncbi:MAG: helix-turn-helix transcriptional regulator [Prevotella sp.]|nr:helix-turn-helix transcriptional regulator [Prevotella sp.]